MPRDGDWRGIGRHDLGGIMTWPDSSLIVASLNVGATLVLVGVTSWYVYLTAAISKSSVASADASKRAATASEQGADAARDSASASERSLELSAEIVWEIHKQRFQASQPLVVGHLLTAQFDAAGVAPSVLERTLRWRM